MKTFDFYCAIKKLPSVQKCSEQCDNCKIAETLPKKLNQETEHLLSTEANKKRLLEDVSKQETTLEEVAERLTKDYNGNVSQKLIAKTFITVGAKWQKEQDKNKYSEEEVILILHKRDSHINNYEKLHGGFQTPKEWFEQFKKK